MHCQLSGTRDIFKALDAFFPSDPARRCSNLHPSRLVTGVARPPPSLAVRRSPLKNSHPKTPSINYNPSERGTSIPRAAAGPADRSLRASSGRPHHRGQERPLVPPASIFWSNEAPVFQRADRFAHFTPATKTATSPQRGLKRRAASSAFLPAGKAPT